MQQNNSLKEAKDALQYIKCSNFLPSFSSLSNLLPCNLGLTKYITSKIEIEKGADEKATDAMILGSCLDRYIFEYLFPLEHDKENRALPFVAIEYDGSLATKEGKAAKQYALDKLLKQTETMQNLGFAPPYLLKEKQIADIVLQAELLQYQFPPNLGASLYNLLINYATDVQKKISIPLPATFYENCPTARGIIDAYGYNPKTGRYYLLDLKRMAKVETKDFTREIYARLLSMQIAMYKKGLESIGYRVDDCYIVGLDGSGNSNIYQFSHAEILNGWQNVKNATNILDELIENGEPTDMLKSFCETRNCAII